MKALLLFFLGFISLDTSAQADKADLSEDKILDIYMSQIKEVFATRGMSPLESLRYTIQGGELRSVQQFAQELEEAYQFVEDGEEKRARIAIVFYFFNHDTLYRYFLTPGKVIERVEIDISSKAIEQLNLDIYEALNLAELTQARAPVTRGMKQKHRISDTDLKKKLLTVTNEAKRILLPEGFDDRYQHLVIIPCLSIGTFPFHLLKPYKDGSYLIDKCSFSIAPSPMDLLVIRKRLYSGLDRFTSEASFGIDKPLFVCNPTYPTNSNFIFPDLPGAKKEILEAIKFSKSYKLLEGRNASKASVLRELKNCDLAYFATHAMSSKQDPLDNNFLVMAGNEDPFLTSRDIMALRDTNYQSGASLHFPQLVILSACQTGLGKTMEAGIAGGLARSFLISGAAQVIMSLWSVDDNSTAYLMSRFMHHMQKPLLFFPAEPLRLAVIDTKKKYPHPSKWASFSIFGATY